MGKKKGKKSLLFFTPARVPSSLSPSKQSQRGGEGRPPRSRPPGAHVWGGGGGGGGASRTKNESNKLKQKGDPPCKKTQRLTICLPPPQNECVCVRPCVQSERWGGGECDGGQCGGGGNKNETAALLLSLSHCQKGRALRATGRRKCVETKKTGEKNARTRRRRRRRRVFGEKKGLID